MATQIQCERAVELFESELSRCKNVVGLGVVAADEDKSRSGQRDCALAVYVKKKVPANRLLEKDLVPESLTISGRNGPIQIRTRVIEQGEVRLE
jgi:hypothetical protein